VGEAGAAVAVGAVAFARPTRPSFSTAIRVPLKRSSRSALTASSDVGRRLVRRPRAVLEVTVAGFPAPAPLPRDAGPIVALLTQPSVRASEKARTRTTFLPTTAS